MSPLVFWPSALGLTFLAAGLWTYRGDLFAPASRGASRVRSLGPVFIAAALATFSGEHFTAARQFSQMVPKWFPQPVFITYVVGVALFAAALSFVARKCVSWSAPLLALLFALFVLLIYLPSAFRHPGIRIVWIFPLRESEFALGAFSLFVHATGSSRRFGSFALLARLWTALVVTYFGLQNLLYPQFSPGVPDQQPTSAWVPLPFFVAYLTGAILVALGIAMLFKKVTAVAVTSVGILMALLTMCLFAPDLFLAHDIPQRITAINFVADTLLFSGTMFAVARALDTTTTP